MRNYNEFLTYSDFLNEVQERVLDLIPDGKEYEVKINKVIKTNDNVLDGLSIIKKEQTVCVAPSIYLNQFYEQHKRGRGLDDILNEIVRLHMQYQNNDSAISLQNLDLFNKDNVIVSVINKKMNQELLKDVPHLIFEDLAIVFKQLVQKKADGIGTILLKDFLIGDADLNELLKIAALNTRRLFPFTVQKMSQIMADILRSEGCPEDLISAMTSDDMLPMYVITNTSSIGGASAILYNDVFKELASKLDSDLYIIPSSIHELIAIPTYAGQAKSLKQMVHEVNGEQVAPEERLSDNIYIFRRATNKVNLY